MRSSPRSRPSSTSTGPRWRTRSAPSPGRGSDLVAGTPEPLVLVVDDEATIRQALERALRLEGFAVETAAGGREALDAVARRPPAVIVLDVTMPDLDGVSVVRRLRAGGVDVPLCIPSAPDEVEDRVARPPAGGPATP